MQTKKMKQDETKYERRRIWRVVRPPLALSPQEEDQLISSTTPLHPSQALANMPLSKSSKSSARYILRKLRKVIRLLPDQSGRFVNMLTLSTSISTLYELLKYFLEGNFDVPQPPDAEMFLQLMKYSRIPAKLMKMFTSS